MTMPITFLWPQFLWLLLALPLLVLLYVWLLRRKKKLALRYASLSIVREAMGSGQSLRRHIPPLLFLLSLAAMLLAAAAPVGRRHPALASRKPSSWPWTSRAACAPPMSSPTGWWPRKTPPRPSWPNCRATCGSASWPLPAPPQVVQPPTLSREDLVTAIDKFQLQRATAIGNGIVVSLAELFPDAGIDLAAMDLRTASSGPSLDQGRTRQARTSKKAFTPVAPGSYTSAAIILLTDGQRTTGVDSLDAAKMAADRGVRVYTVGVGTVDGETIGFEGWSMRVQARRGHPQGHCPRHPGRVLLCRHGRRPEEGLRNPELAADGGEKGNRDLRPAGAGRRRRWRCCRPACRCCGSTGFFDSSGFTTFRRPSWTAAGFRR